MIKKRTDFHDIKKYIYINLIDKIAQKHKKRDILTIHVKNPE